MSTKVLENIRKSKSQLEKGRAIIAKLTEPKKVYSPFIYNDQGDSFYVVSLDQFENEHEHQIPKKDIYAFIADFYRATIDQCVNGEHIQYDDTASPEMYFQENREEVLTDFLNNRKSWD